MKIYLAADHAGFKLKEQIKTFLINKLKLEVKDFGAFEFNPNDDYPDFIIPAIKTLSEDFKNGIIDNRAVIFGGSGQGEAIIANRFKGIRAALYYGGAEKIIKFSREHNDANVLSLGARFIPEKEAKKAVKIWLKTPFPNPNDKNWERHKLRIDKIDENEKY